MVLCLQLVVVLGSSPAQAFFSSNPLQYKDKGTLKQSNGHLNVNWASTYDAGLFTPLEDFRSFSETEFSTFGHPAFPRHSVRIKKNPKEFCDSTVRFVAFTIYEYFSFVWRVL